MDFFGCHNGWKKNKTFIMFLFDSLISTWYFSMDWTNATWTLGIEL